MKELYKNLRPYLFGAGLFVILPFGIKAQVLENEHRMRAGDRIVKEQVLYIKNEFPSKEAILDLTGLVRIDEKYSVEYAHPSLWEDSLYIMGCDTFLRNQVDIADLLIANEHHTNYYYRRLENGRIVLLGFENPVTLMHHTNPMLWMTYPLIPGDEIEEVYETEGWYSGLNSAGHQGSVQISAHPWGEIILPCGDTLRDVTLLRRVQQILINQESRQYEEVSSGIKEIETLQWYARGYRYPIFETLHGVTLQLEEKEELFCTAFFYPPSEHSYLEEDMVNLAIHDSWEKADESLSFESANRDGWQVRGDGWSYRYAPNPTDREVQVHYLLEKNMGITLSVYTMSGALLQTMSYPNQPAGYYTERLDFSSYAKGQYLLSIRFDNEVSSRIIIKK